jgi:hypothetical protein
MLLVWICQYAGAFLGMITTRAFRIKTNVYGKAKGDLYYPRISWFGANITQNILLVDPDAVSGD